MHEVLNYKRGDAPHGLRNRRGDLLIIAAIIVVTVAAPLIGGLSTAQAVTTWYQTIPKPTWNPPSWVFGPVWTVLYILMAVAAVVSFRAARRVGKPVGPALGAYFVQIALNTVWSIIFFGFRAPGWAFVEILALLVAILITTFLFARASKPAAIMMIPYILWVCFAAALNFAIYRLNAS